MKLFLFDEKHQQILDSMNIDDSSLKQIRLIIEFLEKNNVLDRYKRAVIAGNYEKVYNDESEEYEVNFVHDQ